MIVVIPEWPKFTTPPQECKDCGEVAYVPIVEGPDQKPTGEYMCGRCISGMFVIDAC